MPYAQRGARWIAHNDRRDEFRIIPMQSALGRALLLHYDLDPDDPSSWLYVERGIAFSSLDAVIRVGLQLGGIWRALTLLRIIPKGLQDRLYYFVARKRYRLSGHADLCTPPDPDVQHRLIR
ncbi:thiol-disulfide oxidoreductase DCC family protein [Roseovarius litorisediminis]|nr:DCC1-like thiol-disulfide oxidoreductase family protein [Roseovarius litorisediminis]